MGGIITLRLFEEVYITGLLPAFIIFKHSFDISFGLKYDVSTEDLNAIVVSQMPVQGEIVNEKSLVKEGLDVYKTYSHLINTAIPFFPKGFSNENDKAFVQALSFEDFDLVNVTTLEKDIDVSIGLNRKIKSVKVLYPKQNNTMIIVKENNLLVKGESFSRARIIKVIYE